MASRTPCLGTLGLSFVNPATSRRTASRTWLQCSLSTLAVSSMTTQDSSPTASRANSQSRASSGSSSALVATGRDRIRHCRNRVSRSSSRCRSRHRTQASRCLSRWHSGRVHVCWRFPSRAFGLNHLRQTRQRRLFPIAPSVEGRHPDPNYCQSNERARSPSATASAPG
jgi:hypothetical protein